MLDAYADIRERIADEPRWWDRHGVPRYHAPVPQNCSHVYADHVAFVEIECQACGERFVVEFATSRMERLLWEDRLRARDVEPAPYDPTQLEYGDPPRHGGDHCAAGDTMTSIPRLLIAAWTRDRFKWEQTHSLVPLECKWMEVDRD